MPWCPKCKTEYREGITHCADCKIELVAEYKDAVLQNATTLLVKVDAEHEVFTKKLHDFLEYSGISSVVLNEGDLLGVYVTPEDFKKAKKCFKAFYSVETEMVMQQAAEAAFMKGEEYNDYFGDDEEEDGSEDTDESSETEHPLYTDAGPSTKKAEEKRYVSAVSRYDDYRSSGITFTVLGGLGILFAILNFMEVFTLFGSTFSSLVLFLMFGIFLALGIYSFVKAGTLKEGAEQEKQAVEKAKVWMEQNFTKDMMGAATTADGDEEIKTEELLYMDRLDELVGRLLTAFPDLHDSLAEQLVEEFFRQFEE